MSYRLNRLKGVVRLMDGATIPCLYDAGTITSLDEHSAFVKEFRQWVAAGNVPQPADPEPTPLDLSNLDNLEKAIKALGLVIADVSGRTPVQIRTLFKQKYDALP